MPATINKTRFGPWAFVTGASSGIGQEFTRQIAASGINVVLAARCGSLLETVGADIARSFGVQYRVVEADLSVEGFISPLAAANRGSRHRAGHIQCRRREPRSVPRQG